MAEATISISEYSMARWILWLSAAAIVLAAILGLGAVSGIERAQGSTSAETVAR
jgi:hypothetical protein